MQLEQGDRVKAAILILVIVGIMGFVVKTAFFRPQPSAPPSSPPPVAANVPAPSNDAVPPPNNLPPAAGPDMKVTDGTDKAGATKVNPFRDPVKTKEGGGPDNKSFNQGFVKNGMSGKVPPAPGVKPLPPGGEIVAEAEFRLAGVLIDSPSVAIVSRGGAKTEFLHVGSKAAYGYKITAIRPSGIRVALKKDAKWIRVGETLDPPMVEPPPAVSEF